MVLAGRQISVAVKKHEADGRVSGPHYAMSGGTRMARVADQFVMNLDAVLGPVDPQLGQHPAASILAAVAKKPVKELDDATLINADLAHKAIVQVRSEAEDLLASHMDAAQAKDVADKLASGGWTHDYPISSEEAQQMGLPISTDIPIEVMDLMRLYPQPTNKQGGVEYLPRKHG